jgi:DNA-binding helix-hairpin-helix protein with protein kinase domain
MLGGQLMICSANKSHLFYNGLSKCPWCSIESNGVFLFVDYAIASTTPGFALETVWARITAVQNPGPGALPSLRSVLSGVEPSRQAKVSAWKRRVKIGVIAAICLAALGAALFTDTGAAYVIWFWGVGFALVRRLVEDGSREFELAARQAEARLRQLQYRWQEEASEEIFKEKLQDLRTLTEEYRKLPERRKQRVRELEKTLYDIQLRRFLEQFDIGSADIAHIKDGRKAMLSSYGIDDAADVTRTALEAVPGFGQYLIIQMLTWRQSLEAKFKFDPGRGIDPGDVQRVDQEIAKRRSEIEKLLSRGPAELNALRGRIIAMRGQLQDLLEKACQDVAQAQADERVA